MSTDPAIDNGAPGAAEAAHFLRRFADLMSNGHNASYLLRAAELLETLEARATAASDEEKLWRYKYETLVEHTDALEAECGRLKDDIEGHVNVAGFILAERDTLKATLEQQDVELVELRKDLQREVDQSAAAAETHETAVTELRNTFEQDRLALIATAEFSAGEVDQQRRAFEGERVEFVAESQRRDDEIAELRLAFDKERAELTSQITSQGAALAASHAASERELEALRGQLATLEAKREELRSAFERISQLRVEPESAETGQDASSSMPDFSRGSPIGDANTIVPKETLRQARAQFEFLANECFRRGDVATQAMCELGAHAMQLALASHESAEVSPIRRVALNILSVTDSKSPVTGDSRRSPV